MTKAIWVVTADEAMARIFSADGPLGGLEEVQTLIHPASRQRNQDVAPERAPRGVGRLGTGRYAADADSTRESHQAEIFAKQVALLLAEGRTGDRYGSLVVVAAPAFLGLLRKQIDSQTHARVCLELDKDLNHLNARELRGRLPERLPQR